MTKKTKSVFVFIGFLIVNFSALAVGAIFTKEGATSDWYYNLNRAPWEPPGWFFGVAWTTIMIFFSFYMTMWWNKEASKEKLISLYLLQLVLNIFWNPVFFGGRLFVFGLIIITLLTSLVGFFLFSNWKELNLKSLLIAPYFTWLVVATSLNAYIVFMN